MDATPQKVEHYVPADANAGQVIEELHHEITLLRETLACLRSTAEPVPLPLRPVLVRALVAHVSHHR